jgi:BatD DUF11 like domain
MKKATFILLLFFSIAANAQVKFKTIVPQQPVVVGESFRVQYVAEGVENLNHLIAPEFRQFRFVRGPEVYSGKASGKAVSKNTIYTLEALEPGRYKIEGALAGINGKNYRSNDAWVEVISQSQSEKQRKENGAAGDNSAYFLKPGEDPYKKIRDNLFVKVMLDRKTCFSGEPVVATFKLYSRLESKSEIVKNPGFYGFTVHDVINLADKVITTETVNGRLFDVHTIRQVQLYPLQAGSFVIDAMEVNNKVEFSRSAVSKKTEQEIAEGLTAEEIDTPAPGTEIFESSVSTDPITITVKPAPAKNKPIEFTGATGRFTIEAIVENKELAKNEEGRLVLTIKGKGNFSQLSGPIIQWPTGIEGFEPTVKEVLDKTSSPLKGHKEFLYSFVSSKPGDYDLPVIKFSFFDPDSNKYKTVSVNPGHVTISNKEKTGLTITAGEKKRSIADVNRRASIIAASLVVLAVLVVLIYWIFRRKEPVKPAVIAEETSVVEPPSVDEILQPATVQLQGSDKDFYSSLYQSLWSHLAERFNLSGTEINKQMLAAKLEQQGFAGKNELLQILQHCETGMFTNAVLEENREKLLEKVKVLLEQMTT